MSTRALQFDILLLGFRDPDTDAPLAFGVVNFLSAGTSNPLTVWDTKEKTGARTSVTLDVNGQAQVYGDGVYKLEILDVDAVAVSYSPIDNVKIRAVSTNVVETNTTYTATTDDDLILCDTSGGAVLINLYPAADFIAGLTIKNISLAGNNVTIDPDGAELIDGAATQDLVDGQANEFFSNGSGWFGNGVSTGTNFTSTSLIFGDGLQEDTAVGVTTIDVVAVYSTDGTKVMDGGTDGTDATITTAEYTAIYHGRVNGSDGVAQRLPSGWSSATGGTGLYTITHTLNSTNYSVIASPHADIGAALTSSSMISILRISPSSFTLRVANDTDTAINSDIAFILMVEP